VAPPIEYIYTTINSVSVADYCTMLHLFPKNIFVAVALSSDTKKASDF